SLAAGAIATAVLVVNNVRDAVTDAKTGKRTLAVRFGRTFGVAQYALLLLVAEIVPICLVFGFGVHPFALASLVTLPLAALLVRTVHRERSGEILNRALGSTARLLLVHGALLSIGIALGGR
ncbi:MAG: UbiA family prenyltransferase, partial [Polyangiaceae bacterium]